MANLLCTKYFFQNTINNIFIYLLAPFIVEHILDLLPYFIV